MQMRERDIAEMGKNTEKENGAVKQKIFNDYKEKNGVGNKPSLYFR